MGALRTPEQLDLILINPKCCIIWCGIFILEGDENIMGVKNLPIGYCAECKWYDLTDFAGKVHCCHPLNISNGMSSNIGCPDFCPLEEYEEWIPVTTRLPLEGAEDGIIGEFLVAVELKNPDPNDEPEAMLLYFDTTSKQFSRDLDGRPYDENHDWHVTHWRNIPRMNFKPVRII